MITQLELTNFSAFDHLKVDFSKRVNLLVGKNNTGKTKLLKAAYAVASGGRLLRNKPETSNDELQSFLTDQLMGLFIPLNKQLGGLVHIDPRTNGANVKKTAQIQGLMDSGERVTIGFGKDSQSITLFSEIDLQQYRANPVYMPTKEILSFMEGFNSLIERYPFSFDQTYQDMYRLLELPNLQEEKRHALATRVIAQVREICDGQFIFRDDGKVTFTSSDGIESSANSVSEGFRRMGLLARLLETGAIEPGSAGSLYWDEPETNLHPKLMRFLAETLLDFSRNKQQIVIATHDYVLLKWFDLLMDKEKGDEVAFHTMYRDGESERIQVETVYEYSAVGESAIADTYKDITMAQVRQQLGSLGQ
ncbi:MAG: ATP-binding protein [Cyanobacteria bacterium J06634_6]